MGDGFGATSRLDAVQKENYLLQEPECDLTSLHLLTYNVVPVHVLTKNIKFVEHY